MTNKSKRKGTKFENDVVVILRKNGWNAVRIPCSGIAKDFKGDVWLTRHGEDKKIECKVRAEGFTQIYDWLGDNYALAIKRDYGKPLLIIRLEDF